LIAVSHCVYMWRTLVSSHRSLRSQQPLWDAHYFTSLHLRRYSTRKVTNNSVENDIPPEKRFFSILVAFSVGCSIYLFLYDPRRLQKNETLSLSPSRFLVTQLTSSEESTSSTKLIELAIPPMLLPHRPDNFSPVWSVYVKDDDIQVERPYTPLHGITQDGRMQFWIKKYPHGEVGRWIHSKKTGDKIEIRCPLTTWLWKDNVWDEVVMISGGTGITPFVQLFNTKIVNLQSNLKTRFTLLHSSRTPGELPPPKLLNPLITFAKEQPDRFKFHVFVDSNDGSNTATSIPPFNIGRIDENALQKYVMGVDLSNSWWKNLFGKHQPKEDVSEKKIMFLVCGPEPYVQSLKRTWQ